MRYAAKDILFFLIFISMIHSGILHAEFGDILSDNEQEVERLILGQRGALIFANLVRDVIEGISSGRIYLARVNEAPQIIIEKDSQTIDEVWYVDLTGNSLKEVAVSWEHGSEVGAMSFEVFAVTPSGRLSRIFPSPEAGRYESSGRVQVKGDGPGLVEKAAFSLTRSLCEVTKKGPGLTVVTSYNYVDGVFKILCEVTEEPETVGQRLNFAAHNFSKGRFEKGLEVARSALEGVRISGEEDLLGQAYSLVARGYKMCGKPELAALYEKRAGLTLIPD